MPPRRPLRTAIATLLAPLGIATAFLLVPACSNSAETQPPPPPEPVAGPPAFPGATGFGAGAKGGRGGRIIMVDTLADSGPGSFRACVGAEGPRVCVFRVAGVIRFTGRPPVISNPYLTIAGQTAPGGGITLAHAGGANGLTPLLIKQSHDIVVRHIRVRNDRIGANREAEDSITIENSRNVIIDHVSASWARDELVNPYGDNNDITISWSIFAEGIPKHDKCALLGSDPEGPQQVSFLNNLCAHNGDRNPDVNFVPNSCVEVVNNVLYDASSQFTEIWESYGGSPVSVVGNVMRKGPSTADHAVGIDREELGSKGDAKIYIFANRFDGKFQHIAPDIKAAAVPSPPCPLTVRPMSADAAYDAVLARAGAFPRDGVDARIVQEVRDRTGHIVHEPGAIPPVATARPYADSDGDGMADEWEDAHGTNAARPDSWSDADGDGVPSLEAFLADLSDRLIGHTAGNGPE
ncbi:pectate lyase [Stakelama saccharophila]|uniref:Pectate lyase n=1 Tax=Stakelama saccharophila TaxID=3075605 RepID=A0ABZ0BA97_9SPHN|nr:pectate lyase [Stakelama sp. W311]WNO54198.1 pectate lyase [Stakelama sp. W311]